LPDRAFRQIALGDITPEVAKKFVTTHLDSDQNDPSGSTVKLTASQRDYDINELDECIKILGKLALDYYVRLLSI
jgi:hypothetical protein